MANRRMFSLDITDSDAFLDMPLSAQALYFHLGMRADDDGFLASAKKIIRMTNASDDDYKLLIAKRFVIQFPDGVCVIKHWKMNNYLRPDRYKPTVYTEHKNTLQIKDNGSYTEGGIPNGNQLATQDRVGKDSIGNTTTGESEIPQDQKPKKKKLTFTEKDLEVVDFMCSLIKRNYPDWQMTGTREVWADHLNRIHRLDGRTYEQIEYMIKWTQNNDFWRKNILSTKKLREKFNDLIPKLQEDVGKAQRPGAPKMVV